MPKTILNSNLPDKLRVDFIGMAFALTIGEIGVEIGKLYDQGIKLREHWYLIAHIFLPIYIIANSWIGWQLSPSKGNREKLKNSFSISFIILLVDLLLVICYFIIVQCIGKEPLKPNCTNQIYWSLVILVVYVIWDFFSKFIVPDGQLDKTRFINSKEEFLEYLGRAYQAPVCIAIIYFVIQPISQDQRANAVLCADLLLIFVFMLFRGLKSFNYDFAKIKLYVFLPSILFCVTYGVYKLYI